MNGMEKRASKRVPVALRIKLRYRKVDTFVSKFATNISATGIFISSRKPKPAGTQLRFELRLADDSIAIAGRGRVSWILEYDKSRPKSPHGMGIEFTSLAKGSRALVEQIVERRIEQGLGEAEGIPHALQEKDLALVASGMRVVPSDEPPSAQSRDKPKAGKSTSPSSNMGVVELSLDDIDSSSIDLQSVLDRAKSLVGSSGIDKELSDIFRVSAAPVAETVDDASHRLAQILGGKAVQSQRTAIDSLSGSAPKSIGDASREPQHPPEQSEPESEQALEQSEKPELFALLEDGPDSTHPSPEPSTETPNPASGRESQDAVVLVSKSIAENYSESASEEEPGGLHGPLENIEDIDNDAIPEPIVDADAAENASTSAGALLVVPTDQPTKIVEQTLKPRAKTGPPPVPRRTPDILANAIESLGEDEHTNPLNDIVAGLSEQEFTPARPLAQSGHPEEVTQEGSVDYILDDDALSELEIVEDDHDEDELDLPDLPKLPV